MCKINRSAAELLTEGGGCKQSDTRFPPLIQKSISKFFSENNPKIERGSRWKLSVQQPDSDIPGWTSPQSSAERTRLATGALRVSADRSNREGTGASRVTAEAVTRVYRHAKTFSLLFELLRTGFYAQRVSH